MRQPIFFAFVDLSYFNHFPSGILRGYFFSRMANSLFSNLPSAASLSKYLSA